MDFGKRLKTLREAVGERQKDMAKRLNVPVVTVSKYERGEIFPSFEKLIGISEVYHCNLNWLLRGVGKMKLTKAEEKVLYVGEMHAPNGNVSIVLGANNSVETSYEYVKESANQLGLPALEKLLANLKKLSPTEREAFLDKFNGEVGIYLLNKGER